MTAVKIPVTSGPFALVDADDEAAVRPYSWFVANGYAKAYIVVSGHEQRKMRPMHRFLLQPPPGLEVDHINGDRLDNRRINLRIATRSQNAMNRPRTRTNTSGFKGVSRLGSLWCAQIKLEGKLHYLGRYADPAEAARAYDVAAKIMFGQYARPNFSDIAS